MRYKIVKGKLYDMNGNLIRPEVGDTNQIQFLKSYEELKREGKAAIPDGRTQHYASAKFFCYCGEMMVREVETDIAGDLTPLEGKTTRCSFCGTKYRIRVDGIKTLTVKII